MSTILLVNFGNANDSLVATSLLRQLKENVSVLVADKDAAAPFRFNPKIKQIYISDKLPNNFSEIQFDWMINLHPGFNKNTLDVSYKKATGFNFSNNSFQYEKILFYDQKTDKNIFQIYFALAGLRWGGEGFYLNYYPKNKSRANRVGLAMTNIKLREFVKSHLNLKESRLWYIPYRKNFFKKVDEINRCNSIITDDLYTLNIALALRKEIYFLETVRLNFKLELFKKGDVFRVPKHLL